MFTIRTENVTSPAGVAQIKASGEGRTRTIRAAKKKTDEQNHAAALGTLLDLMVDDTQRAALLHPAGGKRVRTSHNEIAPGVFATDWYVDI